MPDLTLCANEGCILKDGCMRNHEKYTNIDDYQSWSFFREYEDEDGIIVCDNYLEKRGGEVMKKQTLETLVEKIDILLAEKGEHEVSEGLRAALIEYRQKVLKENFLTVC